MLNKISSSNPVLPNGARSEHYDFTPDDIPTWQHNQAFKALYSKLKVKCKEPDVKPFEPENRQRFKRADVQYQDDIAYKTSNDALIGKYDDASIKALSDSTSPANKYMRRNGAGQSKWAFIAEKDISLADMVPDTNQPKIPYSTRAVSGLDNKLKLMSMFADVP